MPFTKTKCERCGKDAESEKSFEIGGETVHFLKCGHMLRREHLENLDAGSIVSLDGKKPFKFQTEGVKFVENSGGRALIADEMGLGKTIQALCTLALHEEMLPAAYFVKSSLKIQWAHEILRWVSKDEEDLALAQVIETGRDKMLPGVKHFLFSFDILRRFKNDGSNSLSEQFAKIGIKTLVIDECQAIKNPESQRSVQVRKLAKTIPNVIALSGTPIKNNASEYFSILNILKPELFSTYAKFLYNECDSYFNGYGYKVGGLKDPEGFKRKTANFIVRRERKEVLPDLPSVIRTFHFDGLGEEVEEAYKKEFLGFRDEYFSQGNGKDKASQFLEQGNILAYLSRMRHLTGLSKINPVVDFVEEFLISTERKLTIFIHHIDVGDILMRRINKLIQDLNENGYKFETPTRLGAELSSEQRNEVVQDFMSDEGPRILIASTLASGEGLNLQKCSDCIVMERQWNPANEEQAEARFIRIGQQAQSVTATYFVAVGTVDEFFSRLVEEKREIVSKTLGSEAVKWDQSSLMKELAETLAVSGGKMWNL